MFKRLSDLWPFAHTWWGYIVGATTILVAVYQGPKLLFETWDWYMARFYGLRILDYLESQFVDGGTTNGKRLRWFQPRDVGQIKAATGIGERRIGWALKQLKRDGKVKPHGNREWMAVNEYS